MIDLASVAKIEAALDDVRASYVREVVDILNCGEIAVVAEDKLLSGLVMSCSV